MNRAAIVVTSILGVVAISGAATLCLLALKTNDGSSVKEITLFVLGVIGGLLAKVGIDAAHKPQDVTVVNPPSDPIPTDPQ